MRILNIIHNYPPLQNSGGEWMVHEMMKFMASEGHHVDVVLPISELKPYEFEGISVSLDTFKDTKEKILKCDVIVSHLDRAGKALNIAEFYRKPFVFVVHNTNRFGLLNHKPLIARYVIYNSQFTKESMRYPVPGIVVHPPVDGKRYKVARRGSKLTLVNQFERKGSLTFQQIAREMPERDFLGVEGGYGKQLKVSLPNITYLVNGHDMKRAYSQTKILLMPSLYESYGRTAVEAMASGIPVIASPMPGLKESLGDAGIFCSAENVSEWVAAIKRLDDPEEYKTASKKCLERFNEITKQTPAELNAMQNFFFDIIQKKI